MITSTNQGPPRSTPALCLLIALLLTPCIEAGDQATGADGEASAPSFLVNGELDLEAAIEHFEDLYRADSSVSEAELTVTRPRRTRTLRMKAWTKGRDKALIIIQSPARERGIATLKVGKNLWNYLPRIRRTIRIPPSMMLASWMGSDFTNDDLVRETSYSDDYSYKLVGRSHAPEGWRIAFEAKPGLVGLWNRIELVVSPEGTIPIEARYYDRKDRLARTVHWDEVKEFDGRRLPAHLTLIPQDQFRSGPDAKSRDGKKTKPVEKTELRYLDIEFDVEVPEGTFSLSELERKR